jgi:hypothetical protein
MSRAVVVRYRTTPEAADENARLVAAVYAALAKVAPADFRYATYRLADGVTFVHVAEASGDANPLASLPEFAEFQRDLDRRCVEPPMPSAASVVGSYGLAPDGVPAR